MIIVSIKKQIRIGKSGNPYASVLLQFNEYRDGKGNLRWITGFGNKRTWAWQEGDDVQPEITEEGKYLNFKFDDSDETRLNVYELPATVGLVLDLMRGGRPQSKEQPANDTPTPTDQDNPFN